MNAAEKLPISWPSFERHDLEDEFIDLLTGSECVVVCICLAGLVALLGGVVFLSKCGLVGGRVSL